MYRPLVIAGSAAVAALSAPALAQSTAFTYQGVLKNAGQPANGLHDLRFTLFNVASGGVQLAPPLCVDNVQVVGGLFTTTIDFGQQFATTEARFIQIESRADTGLSCATGTGFTILSPRQALTSTPLANHAKSAFALDAADGSPANAVFVDDAGNVGIGTTDTTSLLTVGSPANRGSLNVVGSSGTVPVFTLSDSRAGGRQYSFYGGLSGLGSFNIFDQSAAAHRFTINSTGNVGIGTSAPATSLHLNGQSLWVTGGNGGGLPTTAGGGLRLYDDGTRANIFAFNYANGTPRTLTLQEPGGNVGIGTTNPQAKLDVAGTARVQVLEITGADIAEKFPASERLEPGMVVAIDARYAGQLCLSRRAYNTRVAGVVSGANNFSVGAVLGHLPGHEDAPAIALSGRVYVHCDATTGAIHPGDLLTTSDTPGHAMKATDRERSHGAVIGKAMEPLKAGERGLVLVLINLQ